MALERMDNVGIVVEDLGAAIDFFRELGLELEGRTYRTAPVNALGYLRVMFAVDDLDDTPARLRTHGAELVSTEVVQPAGRYTTNDSGSALSV
ncbi:MAG: hypothetical protein IRZ16_20590 [Myxococcaceae bacterium]|nr:hypothetical protein [Myxococcaceae bacterium]